MQKTHIFDQKNNTKKYILPTYLPYFFQTVTGNKQYFFLGLILPATGTLSQDRASNFRHAKMTMKIYNNKQ